ncbi:MAG: alpha/beta hydrolase, partial [Chloroflexi bacterium]|nr:alpha/beta hydrolase [Chloroflexota bacterium]
LGVDRCALIGTSFGAITAAWIACLESSRLSALVLESPGAIRPDGHTLPAGTAEDRAALLYAHPERVPASPPLESAVAEQQERLVRRLLGPNRDPQLESGLRQLSVPTLVLFGTRDQLIPPEMGREYRRLIPECHFILVYNAGHAIGFDRPQAYAELVGDFLARREAFVVSNASELLNP